MSNNKLLIISIILLLGIVGAASAFDNTLDAESGVISDYFDVVNNLDVDTGIVFNGSYSFELQTSAGTESYRILSSENYNDIMNLSFAFYATGVDNGDLIAFILAENTATRCGIEFGLQGNSGVADIKAYNGVTYTDTGVNWVQNQWNNVTIVSDNNNNNYSVWVNDVQVINDYSYRGISTTCANTNYLAVYAAGSIPGEYYFDDLRYYNETIIPQTNSTIDITAKDGWDDTTINNFSISIQQINMNYTNVINTTGDYPSRNGVDLYNGSDNNLATRALVIDNGVDDFAYYNISYLNNSFNQLPTNITFTIKLGGSLLVPGVYHKPFLYCKYGTGVGDVRSLTTGGTMDSAIKNITISLPSNCINVYDGLSQIIFQASGGTSYIYEIFDINMSYNHSSQTFSTTTGNVTLPNIINGTYVINVTYPNNYFNNTNNNFIVVNDTSDYELIVYPNQSAIMFDVFASVTNNSLSGLSINVSDGTNWELGNENHTWGLTAGDYNATITLASYKEKVYPFTITALDNKTINITGLYQSLINITANNSINSSIINNYSGWISSNDYTYNQSFTQDNNTLELIDGEYTIYINAEGYVPSTQTYTISGDDNKTILLHPDKSLYLYVKNTLNNDPLTNVTIVLYGEGITYDYLVSDYNYSEGLIAGTYDLVATKEGYGTFTTQITIADNTYTNITAYLSNNSESQQTVFYVTNEFQQYLAGALITITRQYDNAIIGSQYTDLSGAAEFYLANNINYYVTVYKQGYNTYSNETLYPIESTYTITLSINTTTKQSYYLGLSYNFLPKNNLQNNTIYNFSFTYNASEWNATSLTLTIYDQDGITINTTTITPNNGGDNIYLNANTSNKTIITSQALIIVNGETIIITSKHTIRYSYMGRFSLKKLFEDIKNFDGGGFGNFGRLMISLIAIIGITMTVTSKTDFFGEPERVIILVWALTGLFSIAGLLYINIGINNTIQQYGIFIIVSLLSMILGHFKIMEASK